MAIEKTSSHKSDLHPPTPIRRNKTNAAETTAQETSRGKATAKSGNTGYVAVGENLKGLETGKVGSKQTGLSETSRGSWLLGALNYIGEALKGKFDLNVTKNGSSYTYTVTFGYPASVPSQGSKPTSSGASQSVASAAPGRPAGSTNNTAKQNALSTLDRMTALLTSAEKKARGGIFDKLSAKKDIETVMKLNDGFDVSLLGKNKNSRTLLHDAQKLLESKKYLEALTSARIAIRNAETILRPAGSTG